MHPINHITMLGAVGLELGRVRVSIPFNLLSGASSTRPYVRSGFVFAEVGLLRPGVSETKSFPQLDVYSSSEVSSCAAILSQGQHQMC